jgi:hypothetical protein
MRRLIVVIGVGLFAVGCSVPPGQSSSPGSRSPAACAVSTLEKGPDEFSPYGLARAGPLWFSAFGRVDPGKPARLAPGGRSDGWKVVIHPDRGSGEVVELSGTVCPSGLPVRFCYTACSWDDRSKTAVVALRVDASSHLDYTGYMVFPTAGLMRLTVSRDSQPVGQTVIDVPSSPNN